MRRPRGSHLPAEADRLVARTTELVARTAAEHPEFRGRTLSMVGLGAESYVYLPNDPRVQLFHDLGFRASPGVAELARGNAKKDFAIAIGKERLSDVDADVLVAYVSDDGARRVASEPVYRTLGAVRRGSVVGVADTQVVSGLSAISVLSVPWTLDRIVPDLAKAAEAAG